MLENIKEEEKYEKEIFEPVFSCCIIRFDVRRMRKRRREKEENAAAKNETKTEYVSKNGNTMVLTLFQNPKTLDIQKTNADYFIPLQIYDRLVDVTVNEAGETEIIPSLAEKWDISEDGLTYTFHLRKGVKFHNGEELKQMMYYLPLIKL